MRKVVKFGTPTITTDGSIACYSVPFENGYTGEYKELILEFSGEYAQYADTEKSDGILVMALNWLMIEKYDAEFVQPVSERIYYQLTEYYLKAMLSTIKLKCKLTQKVYPFGKFIGTGMSCGVDSIHSYVLHKDRDVPEDYKINMLTYFESGALTRAGGKYVINDNAIMSSVGLGGGGDNISDSQLENARNFAKDAGLPLMFIRTNIPDVFPTQHTTIRHLGIILVFQKMFRVYYNSSSFRLDQFMFRPDLTMNKAHFEIFHLPLFSSDNITFYSSGATYDRVQKTSMIADNPLTQKYLQVCLHANDNCGMCIKCVRTLTTLDALGKLWKFEKVFDLKKYAKYRARHIGNIAHMRKVKTEHFAEDIYDTLKVSGKIPAKARLWEILFWLVDPLRRYLKSLPQETKDKIYIWALKHNLRMPW